MNGQPAFRQRGKSKTVRRFRSQFSIQEPDRNSPSLLTAGVGAVLTIAPNSHHVQLRLELFSWTLTAKLPDTAVMNSKRDAAILAPAPS